ncbi:MAG: hypothetical protein WCS30_05670 [Selenomonadaceae bacterium]
MKQFGLRILLMLSLIIGTGAASAFAQNASDNDPVNLTIEQFSGNDFTFLNLPSDQKTVGYEIFTVKQAEAWDRSYPSDFSGHVGKEVTVTKTVWVPEQKEYLVYMTVNDTGEKLAEPTRNGQLASLVLSDDLAKAKEKFLGKTVYPKVRGLIGLNSAVKTPILIGSPVDVVDVIAGTNAQTPISLIVKVNGEQAVLPIAYSWTNLPAASWSNTAAWKESLFLKNPRKHLGWSRSVWENVDKANVVEGMTKDQVLLSWGKPNFTEDNGTVWTYGRKILTFSEDKVKSIEVESEFKSLMRSRMNRVTVDQ